MDKIIVEITHRKGFNKEYKTFRKDSISIGRAFDNDIVIHDTFIDAHHLILTNEEGHWTIEDQQSENGTFFIQEGKTINSKSIESGEEILIGKTRLRFFSENHIVTPTKSLNLKRSFLKEIDNTRCFWFSLIGMITIYIYSGYMENTDELTAIKTTLGLFMWILLCIGWSAIWSLMGKIIKQKARFPLHLSISCFFLALLVPLDNIITHIGYLSNSIIVVVVLGCILGGGLYMILIMGHLAITTHLRFATRLLASFLVTLSFYLLLFTVYWMYKSEFHGNPQPYLAIKPPFIKVVQSHTIDEFMTASDQSFEKSRELAKK